MTSLPAEGEASRMVRQYVQRAHEEGPLTDGEAKGLLGLSQGFTSTFPPIAQLEAARGM